MANYSIRLYPVKNDGSLGILYLPKNESLSYKYSGKSGDWQYVKYQGHTYSVRNSNFELGYKINDKWFVPLKWLNIGLPLLLVAIIIFIKIVLFNRKAHRMSFEKTAINYKNEANFYKVQAKEARAENIKLNEKLKSQVKQQNIVKNKRDSIIEKEKNRYQAELRTILEKESRARYKTTLSEMQLSYDRLLSKYDKIKNEAEIFGIYFDDPKYENLLKGRRYEICVATSLVKNNRFKILEWAPDKGFESGIKVESNGNPDLVVRSQVGYELAIECKYRSKSYRKTNEYGIDWSYVYQVERYMKFSKNRNIPVFIAIGFLGDPTDPEEHYLISLEKLLSSSSTQNFYDSGMQEVVDKCVIPDALVNSGDYGKFIESGIIPEAVV